MVSISRLFLTKIIHFICIYTCFLYCFFCSCC